MAYPIARRLLFALSPEVAHHHTLKGLHAVMALPGGRTVLRGLTLGRSRPVEALGLHFDNPVGLAAGFDKDARHVDAMAALGFGFVEVGSVTARPSPGNPLPRVFRLPADGALINRMGLNNQGAEATAARLAALIRRPVPIFVNVAKSHDGRLMGDAAIDDYVRSIGLMAPVADALVLNISCPNSGDGRTFEDPDLLRPLLVAVMDRIGREGPPLVVKVSPDLDAQRLRAVARLALDAGASGFTATNTTVDRSGLKTPGHVLEVMGRGGLSGAPLHERAVRTVRELRAFVGPEVTLIGVGGIRGPAQARAFIEAGADLLQLYTGFIYGGPSTVRRICAGLD